MAGGNQPHPRRFDVNPKGANVPPLLLGFMGPPGGGKTLSALRVADGICRVRGGKPFLIDTEAGRALRYHVQHGGTHDFDFVQFTPPFVPEHFLDAIKQGVAAGAGCIIVDSMSDEHEGEGGVLDWHDQEVPKMGGNEWAAWSKPKASRRKLISGIQQIKIPLIVTFRAREKTVTKQVERRGRTVNEPQNIGYQPIAPLEIVHTLDLTCLLPPRADGVAQWSSPKEGEDFVIKLPQFLAPLIRKGEALDEDLGMRLARWQAGETSASRDRQANAPAGNREPSGEPDRSDAGQSSQTKPPTDDEAAKAANWADQYIGKVGQCASLDSLIVLRDENHKQLARISESYPDLWQRIREAEDRVDNEGGDMFGEGDG